MAGQIFVKETEVFLKLSEESANERQKPLNFKTLAKRIKKITVKSKNKTDIF